MSSPSAHEVFRAKTEARFITRRVIDRPGGGGLPAAGDVPRTGIQTAAREFFSSWGSIYIPVGEYTILIRGGLDENRPEKTPNPRGSVLILGQRFP